LAIVLALYDKYLKIPSIWKRANANADILNYDGLKKVCSDDGHQHEQSSYGGNWKEYLHLKQGRAQDLGCGYSKYIKGLKFFWMA